MTTDVTIIASTSPDFPSALRSGLLTHLYPQLWAIGNLEILKARLLGFFGSSKYPGNVIVHIYDLARALRDAGIPVIGGFHAPMKKNAWTYCCAAANQSSSALPAALGRCGSPQPGALR
jgi:hypothetical protein